VAISNEADALRALASLEAYIANELPALEEFSRLHGPLYAEMRRLKVVLINYGLYFYSFLVFCFLGLTGMSASYITRHF
jgi:hypothetical protein